MPTKLPRLNIVLDSSTDEYLGKLAKKEGVSKSLKARDLIREALETYEDMYWSKLAEERLKTYNPKTAYVLEEVKGKYRVRKPKK